MNASEYLVYSVLLAFLLFGLGNFIYMPVAKRRFYREYNFTDHGKSALDVPKDSVLLQTLATSALYKGEHKNQHIEQCKAHPITRRNLTLSKNTRKHNQSRWSVTRLHCSEALIPFCLLPLSEAATKFIMMDDLGVDLSDDREFEHRFHLRTDHPEPIKRLITETIREFLLLPELVSIECIDNTVLIKRVWPTEKIKFRLLQELNCSVEIVNWLSNQPD